MKNIALLAVSLILVNCGTVVGNGRSSQPDQKTVAAGDKANTGSTAGSGTGAGDNYSPPTTAENAVIYPLQTYFLVSCASPFATANSGSYSSSSAGNIVVSASGDTRTLVGAISATITLDSSVGPYAIEEVIQAPKQTCDSKVETPLLDGFTRVQVTFSDTVSIEWIYDNDGLLSFKALSADGKETIEYRSTGTE